MGLVELWEWVWLGRGGVCLGWDSVRRAVVMHEGRVELVGVELARESSWVGWRQGRCGGVGVWAWWLEWDVASGAYAVVGRHGVVWGLGGDKCSSAVWTMSGCIVYTRIRLLLLIRPFISSFLFLSNFQTLKVFVALFSGTMRPTKLKLGTHTNNSWMYRVYWNQTDAAYSSLNYFIFLSLLFSNIYIFVALFS